MSLSSTSQSSLSPAPASLPRRMKELCFRLLTPTTDVSSDMPIPAWQEACLRRADELTHQMEQRYTLFIGIGRDGLMVANLLANRFGASLAEMAAFDRGLIWMSGQVKEFQSRRQVLLILPSNQVFSASDFDDLESALRDADADATSIDSGTSILPLNTIHTLSLGPRRPA